ncbi:MAG: hypothetical protein EOP06_16580 [Proteobacteria bacterium]|nr:MAG: hypothetical protein EOP06_16580 [Pseudomonadota bacterium]
MPTEVSEYPPHLHRILTRYSQIMGQLDSEYQNSKPEASDTEFREQIFEPVRKFVEEIPQLSSVLDDPKMLERIVNFISGDKNRIESDVAFLHLACVYAVAAVTALERGDKDLAWDLLGQAAFRIGSIIFINRGEELTTTAIVSVYKKTVATDRGIKRHAKTNELKKQALDIVRSRTDWKSQASAVRTIQKELEKNSINKTSVVSEETIRDWVKNMEGRSKFIVSLPDSSIKK